MKLRLNVGSKATAARRLRRRQLVYTFVVLLFLAATVLPSAALAQSEPAAELAAGAVCSTAALTAGAAIDPAFVAPASPDAPAALPKAIVDRSIFVALWRNRLTDAEAVDSLMQSLFLLAGAGAHMPQLTAAVRQRIPAAELNDTVKHPLDEIIYVYLDRALALPGVGAFAPQVWSTLNAGIPRDDLAFDSAQLVGQSARRYNLGQSMLEFAQEYMAVVHDCARQNPTFAAQFDALHAARLSANIRDGALTLLQKNPTFLLPAVLVQSIQPDGSSLLSLNQVNAIGAGGLSELNATMDEMIAAAKEIDGKQKGVVEYNNDPQKKEEAIKLAKEKAAKTEEQYKKAQSAINAAAGLISQYDPTLGKQFKTMTSSYLTVVKAVNTWLEATAGLSTLDSIFSLSTATMTGDVVGAVMNIVSLFGAGKSTPEEQILAEIGKLRQQVNQLRQEMHTRFDRIDAQLNAIYTTMQQRFDQVDIQLGVINGNLREVQRSLIDLDLQLSQFERNNFELLNVLGRRPLLDAINAGLDYQRVTGQAMPYQPTFVGFERTFHTWGTVHAFDPLNTGPTQRDFTDGALFHELTTYPLDTNLNYLNGWLPLHGLPPIAGGMLANPRDWLLASRAYTQLGAEWPQHMAQIDAAELNELMAVGLQLEQAIARIAAPTSVNAGGESIFDVVAALYNSKMAQLDGGLAAIENTYLEEQRATFADAAVPFNLFGGAEQTLVTAPGSTEPWMPVGYTRIELDDPPNFQPVILSVPLSIRDMVLLEKNQLLAEFLKNPAAQTRITAFATETNRTNFPCQPPLKPVNCSSSSNMTLTVELRYGTLVWKTLLYDMGQVVMGRLETPVEYLARTWESRKPEFDAVAQVVPPSPDQQAIINTRFINLKGSLDAKLQQMQQGLYARMVDQMDSGTLHALMVEIAGVKKLLDAFTTLGLPRAVANDEFLHAILFGNERIFDDVLIINTFALAATQPIVGPALLVNQRPLLAQNSTARVLLYITIVDEYLAAIAAGPTVAASAAPDAIAAAGYVEGADYLASARRALELTVRIARITPQSPVPAGSFRVFLPVVDR